jgi:spermidine/putrescine transport system permease protein
MKTNWVSLLLRTYLVIALFFVFAPSISLALFSFHEGKIQNFPIERYSTYWYKAAWGNQDIRDGFFNSVIVGVMVSIFSMILGFLSSHLLCRHRLQRQLLYVAFVSLAVVTPLLLSGMALLMYFQRIHLAGTLWAVIIAHTCFCSPFALALIRNPYEQLNIELEYAARNLGANKLRVITRIIIPQLWPAIAAAGLLSFLVSWDEFILAWFVGGFNKTLPVVIYGMMGSSFNPSLNAVGTVSMLISAVLLLSIFLLKSLADRKVQVQNKS